MLPAIFASSLYLLIAAVTARAGLHYSGEQFASLPTQWRGFLLDHRSLRNIANKAKNEGEAGPMRTRYRLEAARLQALADKKRLGSDGLADLGALYIRLGELERAIEVLRPAHRIHGNHFAVAANLGTAWQLRGDYQQAASALEDAVRLAPGKLLSYEEAHLKLVRLRQRGKAGGIDNLFDIQYGDEKAAYEPGKLAPAELKKLPTKAVSIVQQLALWLPADGPLLWQLAELANAHGDFRNGAAMMEGCVVQFGMQDPALRKHRHLLRDAVDDLPRAKVGMNEGHGEQHKGSLQFRSRRPLISKVDSTPLPAIDPQGINPVPWELFGETSVEKPFRPKFSNYLQELQGKRVSMTGFMYPLREEPDANAFLFIESPVGCWYCEMPDTTGIVYVEMPTGQAAQFQRGMVRIDGRLRLNASDPEDFLYAVKEARVRALD